MDLKHNIVNVSYIRNPVPNTAMYVTAKVGYLCEHLRGVEGCLVFAEEGMDVPEDILAVHDFRFFTNPLFAYAKFAIGLEKEQHIRETGIPFRHNDNGAVVSEAAVLGKSVYVGANSVIGPDVVIGDEVSILDGAIVNHAIIGNRVTIDEQAVIGSAGFTMAKDLEGNNIRIPALGKVEIEDDVEIGPCDTIARGSAANTRIEKGVKLDARVHLGECAVIGTASELAAGCTVAGYAEVGSHCFLGLGSVIKNRIQVTSGTTIGMGAILVNNARKPGTYFGNPARLIG